MWIFYGIVVTAGFSEMIVTPPIGPDSDLESLYNKEDNFYADGKCLTPRVFKSGLLLEVEKGLLWNLIWVSTSSFDVNPSDDSNMDL